jgi:hypothetical protein
VVSPEGYDRAGKYAAVYAMTRGSDNIFGAILEILKASDNQSVRQRLLWLQVVSRGDRANWYAEAKARLSAAIFGASVPAARFCIARLSWEYEFQDT